MSKSYIAVYENVWKAITMMTKTRFHKLSWCIICLSTILISIYGQNEICNFYGLNADCRYRVDMICLSHITADIDPCADPVEVTFTITCPSPRVDFRHTFSSADTMVSVPGYERQVFLQVKMKMKEDEVFNIEADIHVYGQARADFLNHDVNLAGYNDKCPGLNEAAKIAIGVMGGLAFIAGCLIIVLLYLRHRRRKNQLARPSLVEYCEDPGQSTPRHSRNFDTPSNHNTQNSINSNNVTPPPVNNGYVRGPSELTVQDSTAGTENELLGSSPALATERHAQSQSHNANNVPERNLDTGQDWARVRYSEMLENYSDVPLKISDC